jgi:hypothetical protein
MSPVVTLAEEDPITSEARIPSARGGLINFFRAYAGKETDR